MLRPLAAPWPEVEPLLASHIWPLSPILAAFPPLFLSFFFYFSNVANRNFVIMAGQMVKGVR
jgi:hypothetical protein